MIFLKMTRQVKKFVIGHSLGSWLPDATTACGPRSGDALPHHSSCLSSKPPVSSPAISSTYPSPRPNHVQGAPPSKAYVPRCQGPALVLTLTHWACSASSLLSLVHSVLPATATVSQQILTSPADSISADPQQLVFKATRVRLLSPSIFYSCDLPLSLSFGPNSFSRLQRGLFTACFKLSAPPPPRLPLLPDPDSIQAT